VIEFKAQMLSPTTHADRAKGLLVFHPLIPTTRHLRRGPRTSNSSSSSNTSSNGAASSLAAGLVSVVAMVVYCERKGTEGRGDNEN
jgi:hypothetical protein